MSNVLSWIHIESYTSAMKKFQFEIDQTDGMRSGSNEQMKQIILQMIRTGATDIFRILSTYWVYEC